MKKFEYLIVEVTCRLYSDELDTYGNEGWELVDLKCEPNWWLYTFKREKEEPEIPPMADPDYDAWV